MTDQFVDANKIVPARELVQKWANETDYDERSWLYEIHIANRAAAWGADQELEACCGLLQQQGFDVTEDLRASRRPKPPSLKEQALKILEEEPEPDDMKELIVFDTAQVEIIRRALEQLDD